MGKQGKATAELAAAGRSTRSLSDGNYANMLTEIIFTTHSGLATVNLEIITDANQMLQHICFAGLFTLLPGAESNPLFVLLRADLQQALNETANAFVLCTVRGFTII